MPGALGKAKAKGAAKAGAPPGSPIDIEMETQLVDYPSIKDVDIESLKRAFERDGKWVRSIDAQGLAYEEPRKAQEQLEAGITKLLAAAKPGFLGLIGECCPHIEVLNLKDNLIGADGAEVLGKSLESCTSIKDLNLALNALRADGLKVLTAPLAGTKIKVLNIDFCDIGKGGAPNLAALLAGIQGLEDLSLEGNRMGPVGAEAIVDALGKMTGLKALNLNANSFDTKSMELLAPAIGKLTGLTDLKLSENNCGTKGAKALAEACKNLTKLESLEANAAFDEDDLELIKANLPKDCEVEAW